MGEQAELKQDHSGQQFGNYRVLRLLGRGGTASVYLGEHIYLKSQAALKILHMQLSEEGAEQFLREAQTLARLSHAHIVRVLDFAVQDGLPYLVMDYAIGGTLRTRHPAGTRLPLEQILTYVNQVTSALQYAHDQRLIHRDVKPENMLLDAHEQVLLADFGLALLTPARSASTQALDPAMAGTAPYLAPEQLQGQPRATSDQYALAVVVYEWLSGQRPFQGTPIEVALQHVSAAPPPLHEHLPDLSPEVEEVVMRALAKEPEQRFPSVQAFATALHLAAHPAANAYITTPAVPTTSAATPGERTATEPFWKVPTSLTPLVGREKDVAAVCALLSHPDVRLLTLLGVGGIGKTRLAIQVATQLRDHFTAGVCFVSLAPISDPTLVLSSVAHELGLQEAGAQPLMETVKVWLRDKQFLLLLDNFEQIVSAAPLLEDLLATCPQLVILVTSREVLHLSAEHLFPVPPLALPDLAKLAKQEGLAQHAAVSLFVQRAQAIKPDFTLTQANGRAIAELCVRLDGLPLAIELAAARIRLLPPQALLTRLAQRFQVLTGGPRTVPERQQTMRNTIQWSYNLLNEEEQQLFRRLSVFVGGCTLEAIETISQGQGDETVNVLDGVASLIDKSLLQQTEQEGEEPRLVMLETIREYGLEALATSGEAEATQQRHADYYLALAKEAEQHLAGPQQTVWLERLEREHDNLRVVMQGLLEPAGDNEVRHGAERRDMAFHLGGALQRFWVVHGHWTEGRTFLERVLTTREGVGASVLAKALKGAAWLAVTQADNDRAEVLAQEGLALSKERGDPQEALFFLDTLCRAAMQRGNLVAARPLAEEALALYRELGDKDGITRELILLARLLSQQGEFARARILLEESLPLTRNLGNEERLASALFWLADTLLASQEDQATVRLPLEESLALYSKLDNKDGIGSCLHLLGQLALSQGDLAMARSRAEESVMLFRELGNRQDLAWGLSFLARVEARQGNYAAARVYSEESLVLHREVGHKGEIASGLEGLAHVVASQGQPAWAARLWGVAEALREAIGSPLPPIERADHEHWVATARTQLGEKAFAAAWAEGRTMTPEQALAAQEPAASAQVPAVPRSASTAKTSPTYPAGLTAREVEVLRLVAQGLTDAQVANQLVISPRTVNTHLTSIYGKIGVSSRSAATRYAIEQHLL